jgi:uncharacterized protein
MVALIFLSLGGTLPFLKGNRLPRRRLLFLIVLTLAGSLLGAWLLMVVPSKAMPVVIAAAMIAVAIFSLTNRAKRAWPRRWKCCNFAFTPW